MILALFSCMLHSFLSVAKDVAQESSTVGIFFSQAGLSKLHEQFANPKIVKY